MTEERKTDPTAGTAGTTGDEPVVSSGGQTVEEVEAFWRNRQSGIQRAHNAETQSLMAQMEALRAQPAPAPAGETPEATRVRELETALSASERARRTESLKNQYPMTAAILGDDIGALDLKPEKLAAMEAAYDRSEGNGPPIIDPNAAPRVRSGVQAPAAKPLNEKSKDELLADLRAAAPAYQRALQEGELDG